MNHHHHKPKCYQYKDCWVDIFLNFDEGSDRVLYSASVEFPHQGGVIDTHTFQSREEAELAAAQLIDAEGSKF